MGSLDNLAANGVIDFDAEAYVKGLPPRFFGHQERYIGLPGEMPLMAEPPIYGVHPGAHLSGHPGKDGFESHEIEEGGNPSWKKALMTVLISGLAVIGAVKYRGKIAKLFQEKKAEITSPSFKQKVSDFFTNAKTKVVEFFKGKPEKPKTQTNPPVTQSEPAPTTAQIQQTVSTPASAVQNNVATASSTPNAAPSSSAQAPANTTNPAKKGVLGGIPKWAKYTGIGLATTLGLYSVYKALSGGREDSAHE